MQYTVVVHNAEEGGYWIEVPSLPGCFSQGETIDEALTSVCEAMEVRVQGLKDDPKHSRGSDHGNFLS